MCETYNPTILFLLTDLRAAVLKPFGLRTLLHSEILLRTPNKF